MSTLQNGFEAHSWCNFVKKKDKAVSFLEYASEKFSSFPQSSETNQTQTWSWLAKNHCLTKPINKTFMKLVHLINSTFLSGKKILDTMIDV